MTFTYNADIATSALDWIRFLVGDTDINDQDNQILQDEEILALIGTETDLTAMYGIAADAADACAAKFRKYPRTRVGLLSDINLRTVVESYEQLAVSLRQKAALSPSAQGSDETTGVAGGMVFGGTDMRKSFIRDEWDYTS
jgi:ribosomal protein S13